MASQKILVIDDSRVIRMRVKDMLPSGNIEVLEAKDGLEGFNLIRSENPNLIMLDFLLPKMSGWEVYQAIQKQAELRAIPLVLMSGRKEEVTEKIPEPFEYFAFVEKPFEKKQLMAAVQDAMRKAKLQPQPATTQSTSVTDTNGGSTDTSALESEIKALKGKVDKMQAEIDALKKQLTKVLTFIKQKLK